MTATLAATDAPMAAATTPGACSWTATHPNEHAAELTD
jgi:hypothetical protein